MCLQIPYLSKMPTKMFSANEIAVFLNQQYHKNELTDYPMISQQVLSKIVANSTTDSFETTISIFWNQGFDKNFSFT